MSSSTEPLRAGFVLFAKDAAVLESFYVRALGFEVLVRAETHRLLRKAGIEVVLHPLPPAVADGIEISSPPRERGTAAIKPVIVVRDLEAARAAAAESGGHVHPPERAWDFGDARVVDGWDPEGNVIQLRELRS